MRTTVNIPDALLQEAQSLCAREGRTLDDVIADGLRVVLFPPARTEPHQSTTLPAFRGHGLQPGADLNHNSNLLDRMDGR